MQIDQLIISADRDHAQFEILLGSLTQALGNQRMVLAQEGANHERRIQILDFGELQTQPRRTCTLAISRKIALTGTEIQIAATEALQQFGKQ